MHSCQTMKALHAGAKPKKGKKPPKKPRRKFFKSVITITILSEDAPINENMELKDIDYMMTEGDCVGEVELTSAYSITRKETVNYLNEMGSQPEFFNLDGKGRDIRE